MYLSDKRRLLHTRTKAGSELLLELLHNGCPLRMSGIDGSLIWVEPESYLTSDGDNKTVVKVAWPFKQQYNNSRSEVMYLLKMLTTNKTDLEEKCCIVSLSPVITVNASLKPIPDDKLYVDCVRALDDPNGTMVMSIWLKDPDCSCEYRQAVPVPCNDCNFTAVTREINVPNGSALRQSTRADECEWYDGVPNVWFCLDLDTAGTRTASFKISNLNPYATNITVNILPNYSKEPLYSNEFSLYSDDKPVPEVVETSIALNMSENHSADLVLLIYTWCNSRSKRWQSDPSEQSCSGPVHYTTTTKPPRSTQSLTYIVIIICVIIVTSITVIIFICFTRRRNGHHLCGGTSRKKSGQRQTDADWKDDEDLDIEMSFIPNNVGLSVPNSRTCNCLHPDNEKQNERILEPCFAPSF